MTKLQQGLDLVERIILDTYARVRGGRAFLGRALTEAFERAPQLEQKTRERIATTLMALVQEKRKLEFALSGQETPSGDQKKRSDDADIALLLAHRLLAGEIASAEAERSLPGVDWSAVKSVDDRIAREEDAIRRFALMQSLPDFLAEQFIEEYSKEAEALATALRTRAPIVLRANTLKTSRDALVERLKDEIGAHEVAIEPTAISPFGVRIGGHANVFELRSFHEGLFEVQDEASQLVADLVAPPPRSLVIDVCAGSGGKTLALGALLGNHGRLVALDPDQRRLDELRHRARRAGLSNVRALLIGEGSAEWPADVAALAGKAARVLVDAPCSGLGTLRRKPDQKWRLAPEDLERLPRIQEEIARRSMALVAPGGRLIYATCALLAAENERVVERLLDGGGFTLVAAKEILGRRILEVSSDATGRFLKLLPHRAGTDGFFAAVLRRAR